mgnify:CR=1 FL=1
MNSFTDKVIFSMVFLSFVCLLCVSARAVFGNSPWDTRDERKVEVHCDYCTPEDIQGS